MTMQRRTALATLIVAIMMTGSLAIPSRVANRMIPSWWINARTKKTCQFWSDCEPGECCVRPMLASNTYCLPLKSRGQTCAASALLVDMEKEVFFDHCPCQSELTCAKLHTHSVCVDSDTLDRLLALPSSPLPIKLYKEDE